MSAPIAARTTTRAALAAAGARIIPGETATPMREDAATDPYLATHEPTIAEAASLLGKVLASGAVARLDLVHDALMTAHRRGRAAERAEVARIAHEHATAFADAVRERADAEFRRDSLPWMQQ